MRSFLGILLLVASCMSCLPQPSPTADDLQDEQHDDTRDPLEGYTEPELNDRLRLLRQEHPFDDEGKSCESDIDCESPLRCLKQATCEFPDAMTGQVDASTPYLWIDTGEGEPHRYFLEIADVSTERSRGLMDRRILTDAFGMLFVFEREKPQSFWMKNTYIPLDIIYIDSNGQVVSIAKDTEPLSTESLPSAGPAQYVLELPAGQSNAIGLEAGDTIHWVGVAE